MKHDRMKKRQRYLRQINQGDVFLDEVSRGVLNMFMRLDGIDDENKTTLCVNLEDGAVKPIPLDAHVVELPNAVILSDLFALIDGAYPGEEWERS